MNRRHFTHLCEGVPIMATLDDAPGVVGLLIVTGGNEIRSGAFSGQAQMAAHIAALGFPVLRFDRRGVGDSMGDNHGFRASAPDIAAAIAAFRCACPQIRRIVALGNCDAASALMLAGGAGCDGMVLTNPWTFESDGNSTDSPPPPQAIRARYAQRLKDPREVWRLISGGVNLAKLMRGLIAAARPAPAASSLAQDMRDGLAGFSGEVRILLAARDRTAQAFLAAWDTADLRLAIREGADHAFSAEADAAWLCGEIASILDQQARQFDMG